MRYIVERRKLPNGAWQEIARYPLPDPPDLARLVGVASAGKRPRFIVQTEDGGLGYVRNLAAWSISGRVDGRFEDGPRTEDV